MDRKEAIEIIRNNWPHSGYTLLREALETLIPELAEIEDEKIRRCVSDVVRKYGREFATGTITKERMLSWLEKQKPVEYSLEQAAAIFLDSLAKTPYNNKPVTDAQVITKELLKFLSDTNSYNPDALIEQKNAEWSEEDEVILNALIKSLQGEVRCFTNKDYIDWLKSLKERVKGVIKDE